MSPRRGRLETARDEVWWWALIRNRSGELGHGGRNRISPCEATTEADDITDRDRGATLRRDLNLPVNPRHRGAGRPHNKSSFSAPILYTQAPPDKEQAAAESRLGVCAVGIEGEPREEDRVGRDRSRITPGHAHRLRTRCMYGGCPGCPKGRAGRQK